jgi:hypothetical protein
VNDYKAWARVGLRKVENQKAVRTFIAKSK